MLLLSPSLPPCIDEADNGFSCKYEVLPLCKTWVQQQPTAKGGFSCSHEVLPLANMPPDRCTQRHGITRQPQGSAASSAIWQMRNDMQPCSSAVLQSPRRASPRQNGDDARPGSYEVLPLSILSSLVSQARQLYAVHAVMRASDFHVLGSGLRAPSHHAGSCPGLW